MPGEPRRPGLGNLTQKPFLEKGETAGRKGFYIGSNKLAGPEDCLEGERKPGGRLVHLQAALNKVLNFPGSRLGLVSDPIAAVPLARRQPGCTRDDVLSLWAVHTLPRRLGLAGLHCWLTGKRSSFLLSFPTPCACSEGGSKALESFLSSRGWDAGPVGSG